MDNKNNDNKDIEEKLIVVCDKLSTELTNKETKHSLFTKFDVRDYAVIVIIDIMAIIFSIKSLLKVFTFENGSFKYSNNLSVSGLISIGAVAIITIGFLIYSIIAFIIQATEKKDKDITKLYKDNIRQLRHIDVTSADLSVRTEKTFDNINNDNLDEYADEINDDLLIGLNDIYNILDFYKMLLRCTKNILDSNKKLAIRNKTHLVKIVNLVKNKIENNTLKMDIVIKCKDIPDEKKNIYIDIDKIELMLNNN